MPLKIQCRPPGHAIAGAATNGDARGARYGSADGPTRSHCLTVYARTRVKIHQKLRFWRSPPPDGQGPPMLRLGNAGAAPQGRPSSSPAAGAEFCEPKGHIMSISFDFCTTLPEFWPSRWDQY